MVDDERGLAESMKTILGMSGYDCAAVHGGVDALPLVEEFTPDLVITDVVMPGMSGIKLASELRNGYPQLPVILLSGNAATEELLALAGKDAGQRLILAKPFSPRELLRVVAELFAHLKSAA